MENGRSDMHGHFGEEALKLGRYSTCLSGVARWHQAARVKAAEALAEAVENETRRFFGGITYAELTQPLGPNGRMPFRMPTRSGPF